MNRVSKVITSSVAQLTESDTARLDVELLLAEALGKNRTWLFTWPEHELDTKQLKEFNRLLSLRIQGRPIAHILGRREFWGLDLECNEHTLIPRPETELLVETALDLDLPSGARVLDLGTGTGAIALALASERPDWKITALDIVPEAIELAKRNAANLKVSSIHWCLSSWFEAVDKYQKFDLIVSNPPYVEENSPWLDIGDLRFEPRSALTAGVEGMLDLEFLVKGAVEYLAKGGFLLLEHSNTQAQSLEKLFISNGYNSVRRFQDLAKHDRVSIGQL